MKLCFHIAQEMQLCQEKLNKSLQQASIPQKKEPLISPVSKPVVSRKRKIDPIALMMSSAASGTSCYARGFNSELVRTTESFNDCKKWKDEVGQLDDPDSFEDKIASASANALLVLNDIKQTEYKTGQFFKAIETIAEKIDKSYSTVERAINELEELGVMDHKKRHMKSSLFRTCKSLNDKKKLPFLSRFLPSALFLILTSAYMLSAVSEDQCISISLEDIKIDIKKSSLRNSIVMSCPSKINSLLQKKGGIMKEMNPYSALSPEDLAFLRGDTLPVEQKTTLSTSLVSTFGCKSLAILPSDADSATLDAVNEPINTDPGVTIAHDLAIVTEKEYSDLHEYSEPVNLTLVESFPRKPSYSYNQDNPKTPKRAAAEPYSSISKRSLALQQIKPDLYGQGATEHIALQYFDMEMSFHSPEGKLVKAFLGNVHQKRFDTWLEDSGATYDQAFDLFTQFKAEREQCR
jgi:DNA-binding transcriptional regulator YhcF (GntR family)